MAQNGNSGASAPENNRQPTAKEIREWYSKNKIGLNYEAASKALKQFRNVGKTNNKTISSFNKETVKTYLKNIGSYEKNLRDLSRYLYYRSQVYQRLIKYNSNMFCLNARSIVPTYDPTKKPSKNKMLKQYYETLKFVDNLPLQYEFLKACTICFREDVFYGCCFYDETGMFILPLDPDYCKISGQYQTGDFSFYMDMSYFRSRQDVLEFLGEPFTGMYEEFQSTNEKWQPFADEYAVCLKARAEEWDIIVPVFCGLFLDLISLLDLSDIQSVADEQEIDKLLWVELETINGSNEANDFKVDPALVAEYCDQMTEDAIPEYASFAMVPGKLNQISFDKNAASDVSKVQKATETTLNTSGGAQILNSSTISGTTAFLAATKSDTEYAISMLLPQIQAWINRFLKYHINDPAKVKLFEVSAYTKDELRKNLLENSQYGLPDILAVNALDGFSELDTLALNYLENECLQLRDKFIPVQSSHTQSGSMDDKAGAPTKDESDLTDDGEKSRDKRDRAKG